MRDLPGMVQKFTRKHIKGVRKEIEHLQHDLEHQLTGAGRAARRRGSWPRG